MKKRIAFLVCCLFYGSAVVSAQCPTSMEDLGGDGTRYLLTLKNAAHCAQFPEFSKDSIQGKAYNVAVCSTNFNVTTVDLSFPCAKGKIPVVLAKAGPIATLKIGNKVCSYNSATGNLDKDKEKEKEKD